MENGVNNFFCFILKKNGTVIELRDNHRNISNPELKSLTNKNWYGALYYEIIPLGRGKYTMLGWNGRDAITTQKIIEVLSLGRKNAKFGANIFQYADNKKKTKRRMILEYANDAIVSLKYYQTKKEERIVFSHLSPSTPQLEGQPQYYYPDLSYDSFVKEGRKWHFKTNRNVKNPKSHQDKNYNKPE